MKKLFLFIVTVVIISSTQETESQTVQNPVPGTKDYAISGGTGSYAGPGYLRIYGVNSSGIGGNVLIQSGGGMGSPGDIILDATGGKINLKHNTYIPKIYDYNNNSYYIDLASSTSIYAYGTIYGSKFIDRNSSSYYLDPSNTGISLKVAGKIESKEIEVVDLNTKSINSDEIKTSDLNVKVNNVADYVFEKNYNLKTLVEVENYINENKHLPDIPAGEDLEKNGMNVAEMNNLLLKKIEELTLYIIEQEKKINELQLKVQ